MSLAMRRRLLSSTPTASDLLFPHHHLSILTQIHLRRDHTDGAVHNFRAVNSPPPLSPIFGLATCLEFDDSLSNASLSRPIITTSSPGPGRQMLFGGRGICTAVAVAVSGAVTWLGYKTAVEPTLNEFACECFLLPITICSVMFADAIYEGFLIFTLVLYGTAFILLIILGCLLRWWWRRWRRKRQNRGGAPPDDGGDGGGEKM